MNLTAIERGIAAAPATPEVQPVVQPPTSRAPDAMLKGVAVPTAAQSGTLESAVVEKAAAKMEEYAHSVGRSLQFRVDEGSGRVIVSVRDPSTGELIRQIPSEAALRIAQGLDSGDTDGASLIIEEQA